MVMMVAAFALVVLVLAVTLVIFKIFVIFLLSRKGGLDVRVDVSVAVRALFYGDLQQGSVPCHGNEEEVWHLGRHQDAFSLLYGVVYRAYLRVEDDLQGGFTLKAHVKQEAVELAAVNVQRVSQFQFCNGEFLFLTFREMCGQPSVVAVGMVVQVRNVFLVVYEVKGGLEAKGGVKIVSFYGLSPVAQAEVQGGAL